MNSINNILVIGKGRDIVKTFYYVFKNNQVTNISFREAWNDPKRIKNFDTMTFREFVVEMQKTKTLKASVGKVNIKTGGKK